MNRLRPWFGLTPGNTVAPYAAGSLAAAALVALALPIALGFRLPPAIAWPVGLTLLAVALFFVIVFATVARREGEQTAELLNGEIWARWTYPSADEDRLAADEWRRTRSTVRQSLGSAVLAGVIVGGTLAFSGLGRAIAAAIGGSLAGVLLLIALTIYLRGRSRFERRRQRSRQVVFGPRAVLREGVLIPLWGQKTRLEGVAVVATDPANGPVSPSILRFDRVVERRSTTTTSSALWWLDLLASHRYWAKSTTEIPVPTGQEAAADGLAERYRHAFALDSSRRPARASATEPAAGLPAGPSSASG